MVLITIISFLISAFTLSICIYQLVTSMIPYTTKKSQDFRTKCDKYDDSEHARFAIIISARNEENVIHQPLDALALQDYPKELFDVFVIADNCTDNTARIAREHGAHVWVRNDTTRRGKGFALNWFFERLNKTLPNRYDAFCVFDADNYMESNYLTIMNRNIQCGLKFGQGYRDISNPYSTWITSSYAIYFWTIMRFYMRPRTNLGLSGIVGGTGFVFVAELVKDGWHTQTLGEDTEFSIQQVLKDNKVILVEDAIFYDEQPETFSQSLKQRYRWALGSQHCLKLYGAKLINKSFSQRSFRALDVLVFLFAVPCTALAAINSLLNITLKIIDSWTWYGLILNELGILAMLLGIIFVIGLFTVTLKKAPLSRMWKGLIGWPFFILSWMYLNIVTLFYRKGTWAPIKHKGTKNS